MTAVRDTLTYLVNILRTIKTTSTIYYYHCTCFAFVWVCVCVFVNRYPDVDRRGVQCAAAGRTDWGEQNKPKHVQTYTTYVTLSATHIRVYVKWHVRFVFEGCRSHFANVLLALHFSLDLFRCLPSNSTE